MQFVQKKWVCFLVLLAFIFESVFAVSYEPWALKNLLLTPFKIVSLVLSPGEAFASTPPDPNDYTINKIPEYFIDISGSGTELTLSDEGGFSGIPIGFDFDFYGTTFNSVTVTSNGYLTFSNLISPQNTPIPSAQTPDSLIAPFWDDLNPELNAASAVYFETIGSFPNRTFIVQWNEVPLKADPDSRLTFEVVLFEGSNESQFHYFAMEDGSGVTGTALVSGSSATIGIENEDGTKGKEVAFNKEGSVSSGSAYSFTLGGNAFETGRLLGDLDNDNEITILDQSVLTDVIIGNDPLSSQVLSLSDSAPQPGTNGRPFGDGIIDELDHERIFEVIMQRENLNPTLSGTSFYIAPSGETLTLYGSGFDCVAANNTVYFIDIDGSETAVTADSINAGCSELTVTVPVGLQFITSIRVEHNSLSSNSIRFVLEAQPLITGLTPDGGEEGYSVLIRGYEFGLTPADNQVSFNGITATVSSLSTTDGIDELNVTVPAGVTTGPVTVTVAGKVSNGVMFTLDGPPVVAIDSPAEDGEITGSTDIIGTASDLKLVSYTLEYARLGESFTTFATGTSSIANDVLGTIDTTLLANGLYQLRLTAEDSSGNVSSITRNILVSGQNKAGIFTITFTDLKVPVSGIPITIKRTYDSRERSYSQDFGHGWYLEVVKAGTYVNNRPPGEGWSIQSGGPFGLYNCYSAVEQLNHITEIRFSDVEFYRFAPVITVDPAISSICTGTASYQQIGGVPGAKLDIIGSNEWWRIGGLLVDPDTFNTFEPENVRLTTLDGRTFDLNITNGLTRIGDTNGNSLFINNNGVVHSSGKSISFTRDGQGRITQITDPMGQTLDYTYDTGGNLDTFTDRDGNTTEFTYDSDHLLIDIIDPLGNIPVKNEYDTSGRLIARIDANGKRTEIDTDIANNTTEITDRLGQVTILNYNDEGQVTGVESDDGSVTEFTYDSRGNKTGETDALGNTRTFTYDDNNNLLSETDALGNTISYTYDAKGRLLTMTDANGNETSYTYDANGNPLSITSADGVVTNQFVYNASGNVTQVTTLGGTTDFTYDIFGNVTRRQGTGGLDITYTYDANGNKLTETVVRTTAGGVVNETTAFTYNGKGDILTATDAFGNATSYTYDANGQVLTRTDARGNTTSYEYDKRGNQVKIIYPDGTFEVMGYDLENRLTAKTDRAGRTTFYEYNSQNKITRTIYPDGTDVRYTYDATGNLLSYKDNLGNTTTYEYDGAHHLTKVIDPPGNETTSIYNSLGVRTSQTDPLGNVTQFGYDENEFNIPRPNKTTFADGSIRAKTYDISGRIESETDEAGNTTSFEYDAAGNLIKVTDPLGNETTYTYDEVGNRLTQTDANGNTTGFEYDAKRNLIKRTMPLSMSETMTYDEAGNMISKTDFNGNTSTFTYDSMNRLTLKSLPGGDTVSYTYTPTGKLETVTDSRGLTEYAYDVRDRVTRIDNPDGTSLVYTYDAVGNRTSVQSPAGTTNYSYDAVNRLDTVTDPDGGVATYSYDAAGNLSKLIHANGTETHYTYDSRNRLASVEHTGSGGSPTLAQFDYQLDAVGNRLKMTESPGRVVDYSYDALHRLIEEDDGTTITTYTYDNVGNRLNQNGTSFSYDANNRLQSFGTTTLTYDNNGNLVTKTDGTDITQFAYDAGNRLIQHTAPDGTVTTLIYDAAGNRVSINEDGTITNFVVDPYDNSGYSQVLAEQDGTGTNLASYVYGNDLLKIKQSGTNSYYHTDALGSTRLLTNPSGSVTDTYDYDAFGNLVALSGATPNMYLFAGEQFDPTLELYYLRARYMDSRIGRFVSSDPFSGSIYDPVSLHKYVYARNNPVNFIDPSGQFGTLAGAMTAVNIVNILKSIAIPTYIIIYEVSDIRDKREELRKIPTLKVNEELTREDFSRPFLDFLDIDEYLGKGAVAKAYSVSAELVGGTGGKSVAFTWIFPSRLWMAQLPVVGTNKPGHYLSCGFNEYVFHTYGLQLVNGVVSGKAFRPALQIIGLWLNYFNFLSLMVNTLNDSTYGEPRQPASGKCLFPGS